MAQDGAPQGQPGPLRWLRQARSAAENLASDGLRSFHHAVGEARRAISNGSGPARDSLARRRPPGQRNATFTAGWAAPLASISAGAASAGHGSMRFSFSAQPIAEISAADPQKEPPKSSEPKQPTQSSPPGAQTAGKPAPAAPAQAGPSEQATPSPEPAPPAAGAAPGPAPAQPPPASAPAPAQPPAAPTPPPPPPTRKEDQAPAPAPDADAKETEERILISEVDIQGVDGALKEAAEAALATRPNFAYTQRDIRNDVERLFEMGYFSSCQPKAEDTRDGVRITFVVQPNPEIKGIVVSGANALPVKVLQDAFAGQYGRTLNFTDFSRAIQVINRWYENRGLFGQVADVEMVRGVAELRIAEVAVGKVGLRFLKAGSGEPVRGRTRPEIIMRHVTTKPGQIYSLQQARRDIDSVYSMGLYDDVSMVPTTTEANGPGAPQVDLTLNVVERRSGGLTAGGGISASGGDGGGNPGFIGNLAYSQRNLMGLNQKLTASVELGQSDVLCRLNHTDPWVWGDPHRTSRTVTLQNTRTSAAALLGRSRADLEDAAQERQRGGGGAARSQGGGNAAAASSAASVARAPSSSGMRVSGTGAMSGAVVGAAGAGGGAASAPPGGSSGAPRNEPHHRDLIIARALCGVEWSRPIREGWTAGAGATLSRVRCLDDAGVPCTRDQYMAPVTFSGTETDLQAVFKAQVAFSPVEGDAQLLASAEYAPPGPSEAWLNFWRMRVRGERQLPIGPCTLVLAGKGGTIKGDLPPYEAFPIGGTNSVRGYEEGGVGTGRQCLVGSAELRWPLLAPVAGCAFIDGGTDLGTGESVSGDPAGTRGKPGMGYGFGAGLRLDSPVGPLRLEYAFNDRGQSRFHFGVGSQM